MKQGIIPIILFIASAIAFYWNPILAFYLLGTSVYAYYTERN